MVRAYATRHGAGPFPTERKDLELREAHDTDGPRVRPRLCMSESIARVVADALGVPLAITAPRPTATSRSVDRYYREMRCVVFVVLASGCGAAVSSEAPASDATIATDIGPETTANDSAGTPDAVVVVDTAPPLPQAEQPALFPGPGTYTCLAKVSLSSATPGAIIHFTVDDTEPTEVSAAFAEPISVYRSITLRAAAFAPGYSRSITTTGRYTIEIPAGSTSAVSYTPPAGTYDSDQTVTLFTPTPTATICYTLDGTYPNCEVLAENSRCTAGTTYSTPITVKPTLTGVQIRAIACKFCTGASALTSAKYTLAPK